MCAPIKFASLLLSLLVVLLAMTLLGPQAVWAGEPQWVEVRSPHFSVATDTGEKRGREVAMRFEQMRAVFGRLMTKAAKVNLPVPLQIVAFRNTKEMRQVAPLWNGKPTQVAGLFQSGVDRCFIMLDMSVNDPYRVVFHEYAHQLMNGNLGGATDPWFEEGFAEFFSTIEVDNKQADVGKIPHDTYLILQQSGMMKITDLFKVVHNSAIYNESGDHRNTFYAESAMVVHYLFDSQLVLKIPVYFDLKEDKHVSVEDAIQQAFGMSPGQFDKALRNYIGSAQSNYYAIPTPANISPEKYTVTTLKPSDSAAILADIHMHSRDYQERAQTEFQDILKSDPNNAAACRGLGYVSLEKQDFDHAAEYFKRASELDSKDPRVHYYYALLMFREMGAKQSADIGLMTKELETAIALDPNFADSYALLAFGQSASDTEQAIATMQKALQLSPRNEVYLYNIATLYLANRQPDQAIAILSSLHVTDNPALATQVGGLLTQLQQFQQSKQTREPVPTALQLRNSHTDASSSTPGESTPPSVPKPAEPKWGAPKFLHALLSKVDCSTEPAAILTLQIGTKTLNLTVPDRSHVILVGTDHFSCSWSKQKVAVNYREGDAGETSVMSVELQ